MFCMGNPHKKQPEDVVSLYFDDEIEDEKELPILTKTERDELQALIDAENAKRQEKAEE